jgi:hypothetical protein
MKATAYFENMPTLSLKKDRILYLYFIDVLSFSS